MVQKSEQGTTHSAQLTYPLVTKQVDENQNKQHFKKKGLSQ